MHQINAYRKFIYGFVLGLGLSSFAVAIFLIIYSLHDIYGLADGPMTLSNINGISSHLQRSQQLLHIGFGLIAFGLMCLIGIAIYIVTIRRPHSSYLKAQ